MFMHKRWSKRNFIDGIFQGITYLFSSISFVTLGLIMVFLVNQGWSLLNFDLVTYNYESNTYLASIERFDDPCNCASTITLEDGVIYSEKWGLGVSEGLDLLGQPSIVIDYIHEDSPFKTLTNKSSVGPESFPLLKEYLISKISYNDRAASFARRGAVRLIEELDSSFSIYEIEVTTKGGGIRGSIITTLWLIGLTLIFALPVGIGAALYLNEYAKKNQFTRILRSFIELLTGVPSIIYGLLGLAIFVPFTVALTANSNHPATGGNIISGAMTLAVILLPVIIRTTEESLKVVPNDYRFASLALGASQTQTTFKVVVPGALPGILASTLLAIGRIVGESAALIFAIGSLVRDEITLTDKSTSLAVHIYSLMTDEPANIALSSTIALIILVIVFVLNLSIKFISHRFMKGRLGAQL
jgi:phosphate transport system permease protein